MTEAPWTSRALCLLPVWLDDVGRDLRYAFRTVYKIRALRPSSS